MSIMGIENRGSSISPELELIMNDVIQGSGVVPLFFLCRYTVKLLTEYRLTVVLNGVTVQ